MVARKAPELMYAENRFCAGCGHGIFDRILGEVLTEMDIVSDTIICSDIGCNHQFQFCMRVDAIVPPHGKMGAALTAQKHVRPDKYALTICGDGGAYAIGLGETMAAATRNENVTFFVMNNTVYGMTGGQMAPTTLEGMQTATCPQGRNTEMNGYPLKISDMLALLDGTCYVTRQSVHTAAAVMKAKKALKKAFQNALDRKGTSVVEIVSTCNTGWKLTPDEANKWMAEHMFERYPLGDLKSI